MEIIFLIIGVLVGIIFCYYFMNKKIKELNLFCNQQKEQNIELRSELEQTNRNKQIIENTLQQNIEAQILRAMQTNNNNFITLANQTFEKYLAEANKNIETKTYQINKVVEPLQKTLEQYEQKVNQFSNQTISGISSINSVVNQLIETNSQLAKQTNTLTNALKTTKVRGRWAEISLKNIVEYVGMNKNIDFFEQSTTDKDQTRPDLIIKLPNNRQIIVDSKLPLEALLDAFETNDETKQKELLNKHLKAMKEAIKNLASKNYTNKIGSTVEFTVLYIAIETALSSTLELAPDLILEAMDKNVIIATPSTLLALLNTINFSWKQQEISQNAKTILDESKELFNRMLTFVEHFSKLQNNLEQINSTYNKMVGSWHLRVEPSLRRIENLGVKINKELPQIDELDSSSKTFSD